MTEPEPEPAAGRVTVITDVLLNQLVAALTSVVALAALTGSRGEFMFLLSRRMWSCSEKQEVCRAIRASRHVGELQAVSSRQHTSTSSFFTFPPWSQPTANICFCPEQEEAERWLLLSVFSETTLCFSRNPQELRVSYLKLDSVKKQSEGESWKGWIGPFSDQFWVLSVSVFKITFIILTLLYTDDTTHMKHLFLSRQLDMNLSRVQSSWKPRTEARTQTCFSLWSGNNLWPGLQFCSQSASSSSLSL